MSTLVRPRQGRIIAGVCAALANRFGWNVTLVRLLAVLSFVLPGSQLIIYVICWIVIPGEAPSASPAAAQEPHRSVA